jgi:transposase
LKAAYLGAAIMDDMGSGSASSHTISHMTTHMSGSSLGRVEIVGGRRRWTAEQKLAMLADAFGPEGSVGQTCERHRIGSGQLYTWRRLAMNGQLEGMTPSGRALAAPAFAEASLDTGSIDRAAVNPAKSGLIGIDLPTGVRLTVDAAVDADALARVLGVLSR